MITTILYNSEARLKLKAGVDKIANAVKVTLGAKGRNVIIKQNYRNPYATKDGVTVARNVFLKDELENVGAEIMKEAASKTAHDAGDGTTTSTILAQAIINAGMVAIDNGANPVELKAGIESAVACVVAQIAEMAIPVVDDTQVLQVATIAGNNDPEIGQLVATAISKAGRDGLVSIAPPTAWGGGKSSVVLAEGLKIDRGYISGAFINNPNKRTCEFDNPLVLLYEKQIMSVKDIFPILEKVVQTGRPVVIIADSFAPGVEGSLTISNVQNKIRCCAIHLPGERELRKEYLLDLAAITGATILGPERQTFKLADTKLENLGTVSRIVADKDSTLIVGAPESADPVEQRIEELRNQELIADTPELKQHLHERIAKLTGGVAVIHVGGTTDIEIRERRDRVDDAIRATQAAILEGVVAGGGICLNWLSQPKPNCIGGHGIGYNILMTSLMSPFEQIIINAGLTPVNIRQHMSPLSQASPSLDSFGYNILTNQYGNMYEMGIIDAAKVVRCALENAASVAIMILMSECMLVEESVIQGGD